MSSTNILSAPQLVRLANKNQLSLALRLQWQILSGHGIDPYNDLRVQRRAGILWRLTFFPVMTGAVSLAVFVLTWSDSWFVATLVAAFTCIPLYMFSTGKAVSEAHSRAYGFREAFSKALEALANDEQTLESVAIAISLRDFAELRSIAKAVMTSEAAKILRHDQNGPKDDVDSDWYSCKHHLTEHFKAKYRALEKFDLVYKGYDHFFEEAKKHLAQQEPALSAAE